MRCPCASCHEGEQESIATLTLNLITRWRWVVSFAPLSRWQEEVYSIFCSSYLNLSARVKSSIFCFNFKPTKTTQCLATVKYLRIFVNSKVYVKQKYSCYGNYREGERGNFLIEMIMFELNFTSYAPKIVTINLILTLLLIFYYPFRHQKP